jgi:membrane protein implicated in regulation of membrane protease activity
MVVLAFIVAAGIGGVITALESGNVEAAIGPLLMTAFAVLVLWRRLRRRQDLSARDPRDS